MERVRNKVIELMDANNQGKASLDSLRRQLTPDQRQILTIIWEYYLEHRTLPRGGWISDRELYYEFGNRKKFVRSVLCQSPLSGSVVFEQGYNHPFSYQLRPLGVFLTAGGQQIENHVVEYLALVKARCSEDPHLKGLRGAEIQKALHLTPEELMVLCSFIQFSSWFWGGGGGTEQDFQTLVPQNVSDLLEMDDLRAYVSQRVLDEYDPDLPVDERGRSNYSTGMARQNQASSQLWFVEDAFLRENMTSDWLEAQAVYEAGANKSCIILCASVLEGLLLEALSKDNQVACMTFEQTYGKKRDSRHLDRWDLVHLVEIGKRLRILTDPTLFPLSEVLREWRNLVHPGCQTRKPIDITAQKAAIAFNTVSICIQDLSRRANAGGQQGAIGPTPLGTIPPAGTTPRGPL